MGEKGGLFNLISVVPRNGGSILCPGGTPGVLGENWGRTGPLGLNTGLGGCTCGLPSLGLTVLGPMGVLPGWLEKHSMSYPFTANNKGEMASYK